MAELMDVQGFAQQVAEAIALALRIDVEIADQNLIRVAGTGGYREGVGKSMDRNGFVYREVLKTGRDLIIDRPGFHELCRPCHRWEKCPEKFEIVCPINAEGRTVGAIGLLCFTDETADWVRSNQDSYRPFLDKMAETIALKLQEKEFTDRIVVSNRYLSSLINCLEEGLVTTDLSGNIRHCNLVAQRMFNMVPGVVYQTLGTILGADLAKEVLENCREEGQVMERELIVGLGAKRKQLMMRARVVRTDRGDPNLVMTFHPLAELSRMVNRLSIPEASYTLEDILGNSRAIQNLRERARVVASSSSTVLIGGESGTGKEMLARAIHSLSPRCQGPFVAINCSAIPETLLESELFGYEDGAFTGARKGGKLGKFELADKGTLFLDEIGDMPLFLQAKLLRVLQDREIDRVGGMHPIPVDVRIIAATNRDLEAMIKQGEFRQDLYYRINVIPLIIPPLRERKEDLEVLCRHFIETYNHQLGKDVRGWSPEFMEKLWDYSWPGNVRELSNVIEYAMNMTQGEVLEVEHLPAKLRFRGSDPGVGSFNLRQLEKMTIMKCLNEYGNTVQGKQAAARALGIGIATLYRKLAQYEKEDGLLS